VPNAIEGMGLVNPASCAVVKTDTNISVAYNCQNVFLVRGACAHSGSAMIVFLLSSLESSGRWIGFYVGKRELGKLYARSRSFGLEVGYLFSLLFIGQSKFLGQTWYQGCM